jgi:hypothetical protein
MVFQILQKYIVQRAADILCVRSSLLQSVNNNKKSVQFLYLGACQQVALTGEQ